MTRGALPPRTVEFLVLSFGFSQFFVRTEPGLPEFLFPFLALFIKQEILLKPIHLLILSGSVFAAVVEFLTYSTATWSLVSIYLALMAVALDSLFSRWPTLLNQLILGASLGALTTIAIKYALDPPSLYASYGLRFQGYFKDPNVAAPTAAYFGLAALAFRRRRWLAIPPFVYFFVALSRATILGLAASVVYLIGSRNRILGALLAWAGGMAFFFGSQIEALVNGLFGALGRGSLINYYDSERSSNWAELLVRYRDGGFIPLGPGFAERSWNGISVHSTYLRLLVEQGLPVLVMFVAAMVIAWRNCASVALKAGLLMILVNGLVVDATHWRVLFIAVAVCSSFSAVTLQRLSDLDSRGTDSAPARPYRR